MVLPERACWPISAISNSAPPVGGDALAQIGGTLDFASTQVDSLIAGLNAPAELTGVTDAVTGTVSNVGTALADFGTDGTPLVDGVASAVSPLLTADVGAGTVAGGDGDSLLGVSLLSGDQQSGSLAELGAGSGTSLLNVDLSPATDTGVDVGGTLANVDLGPVTDGVGDVLGETGLADLGDLGDVGQVADLGDLGDLGDGSLTDLTDPVTDLVSGVTGEEAPDTDVGGVVGGVLGGLGLGGSN